jgi:hypothetical protein
MLDNLEARMLDLAERMAARRMSDVSARIEAELPRGVSAARVTGGIELSGRGLKRRFALEPTLRWLLAGLK